MTTSYETINIDSIAKIEQSRLSAGYKESDLLLENYDLDAFLNGAADNITLATPEIQRLAQIKLDWEQKKGWIWDKSGISGWNLADEKRFKLFKNAQGPMALALKNRLLAYQEKGLMKIVNVQTGKMIYEHAIEPDWNKARQSELAYFTPDEQYFIYFSKRGRLSIVDLKTLQRSDIDLGRSENKHIEMFHCMGDYSNYFNNPYAVMKDGYLLAYLYQRFLYVPLAEPAQYKFLNFSYTRNDPSTSACSIALSEDEKYLYLDSGFTEPIRRYRVKDLASFLRSLKGAIVGSEDSPPVDLLINIGATNDFRQGYIKHLDIFDNILFRWDGSLAWINLNNPSNGLHAIKNVWGSSIDYAPRDRVYAIGNEKGFVVIQKFPDPDKQIH